MRHPSLPVRVLLALTVGLSACQTLSSLSTSSNSVNSISESSGSVSSLSESLTGSATSSTSSLGGEESAALERDVETATALFTENGGDADAVMRGVGALCERYALTDWETEPAVRRGLARGLAASGLPADEVARFAEQMSGPEPAVRDALRDALAARP